MPADLRWTARPATARAVVLVLHGGQATSLRAARWSNLAVLRMLPIARSVASAGAGSVAVARLRYAVRGWNGVAASPLRDARAALDDIGARYPGVPLGLVGHSMGGRVALALVDDPRVQGVVGLAPWVERGDDLQPHPGLRLLVLHGLADRMTSASASRQLVEALQARGASASFVGLRAEQHAMLARHRAWDQLTAGYLRAALPWPSRRDGAPELGRLGQLGARAACERLVTVI